MHTIETSPETISQAHHDVILRHGIGRVSMGVQSLVPEVLDTVHRGHEASEALAAGELLVASGLVVNVDLIYGLPGQTPESFLADLTTLARARRSRHHLLQLPRHRAHAGQPSDRRQPVRSRAHHGVAHAFVKESAESLGYTQTRWHTFKRMESVAATHERMPCFDDSLHGFQLGVGIDARSHLGHAVYRNHPVHDTYIERIEQDRSPVQEVFRFDDEDRLTQFVARSLGDGNPLSRAEYGATFGHPIDDDFGPLLDRLRRGGLVEDDGETLLLSERGKLVYDLVTLAFYPARARTWLEAHETGAAFVSADPVLSP